MTTAETIDLFSPERCRERVVTWPAPGPVAKVAAGMSGMEAMCAIRDGRLPGPPMAYLIRFRMSLVEQGRIVMELDPEESLENTIGLLHGAVAAALLDTAMGCAISTMLPAGQASVTLDLKLTYLRPLSVGSGTIAAAVPDALTGEIGTFHRQPPLHTAAATELASCLWGCPKRRIAGARRIDEFTRLIYGHLSFV